MFLNLLNRVKVSLINRFFILVQKIISVFIYFKKVEKAVLFVIPTGNIVNGGVISIINIYEETRKLYPAKSNLVLLVTPRNAPSFLNFSKIDHKGLIFNYNHVWSAIRNRGIEVICHVPEYFFLNFLTLNYKNLKKSNNLLKINILNQNIQLMPSADEVKECLNLFPIKTTITTAHFQYSSLRIAQTYSIPFHYLSVNLDIKRYTYSSYSKKENLICISPDHSVIKSFIIDKLCKNFDVVEIKNISYKAYLQLISKAKYTITFGEGLDGYFTETIFSGGIGIAIYNNIFFTDKFESLAGVFKSENDLCDNLLNFIDKTNNENEFTSVAQTQFNLCHSYYDINIFRQNILDYYHENYNILK